MVTDQSRTAMATAVPPARLCPLQEKVKLLIGGEFVDSQTSDWIDVRNPATQEVVSRLPLATEAEFNAAVAAAKEAFPKSVAGGNGGCLVAGCFSGCCLLAGTAC